MLLQILTVQKPMSRRIDEIATGMTNIARLIFVKENLHLWPRLLGQSKIGSLVAAACMILDSGGLDIAMSTFPIRLQTETGHYHADSTAMPKSHPEKALHRCRHGVQHIAIRCDRRREFAIIIKATTDGLKMLLR